MSCVTERYICITNCDVIPCVIGNAGVMWCDVCCRNSWSVVPVCSGECVLQHQLHTRFSVLMVECCHCQSLSWLN